MTEPKTPPDPSGSRLGTTLIVTSAGALFGALLGAALVGDAGAVLGALAGLVLTPTIAHLGGEWQKVLQRPDTGRLVTVVAYMLDDPRLQGAQAAGSHQGQAVRFWTEGGTRPDEVQLNCSVRAARGEVYLDTVDAADLGVEPFAGPGRMVVRPGGLRVAWEAAAVPDKDACKAWIRAALAEAEARRVPEGRRLERLVELVEADKPSAVDALALEDPEQPDLAPLAERLARCPAPGARLVAARWQGADALEALVDDLTHEPIWQARALRARAALAPLPDDAVHRWAGVPGLHLELLIDQTRRGPLDVVQGLVDAAPTWGEAEAQRLEALAEAIIARGPEVAEPARRLFEGQPAGRRPLARALGEVGGVSALMALRAALYPGDWPALDEEEADIERALARITHRLGDAAAGELALGAVHTDAGGLSLDSSSGGGLGIVSE